MRLSLRGKRGFCRLIAALRGSGSSRVERTRRNRHHHGKPVRLGDDAARGRNAGGARHIALQAHHLGAPHPRPALSIRQGRARRRVQGDHRRRRRRRAPAGNDGRADALAGARRSRRIEGPVGPGFALFDRPDAGRHPGRHAGDRQGRRDQCGAACRLGAGALRRGAGRPPRSLARQPDRCGRRAARRTPNEVAAARRRNHRHHRRRPARPHAGDGRRPPRLPHRHPRAAGRLPGRATRQPADHRRL